MRRLRHSVLLLLACGFAGAGASARLDVRTLAQDEREVLRAVIRHMQTADSVPAPVIASISMELDRDSRYLFPDADALQEERIRFPPEVFPDVMQRNRMRVSLATLVGDGTGARWITDAQIDSMTTARATDLKGEMRVLGQMFSGARSMSWLSRPGFDEPRSHASVAYGWNCGDLCGTAGVYLLERRAGRWHVIERVGMLVS
jgi:hypothetical protein